MADVPSYCKKITDEINITIKGDTFSWMISPLTNSDDSPADTTLYTRITAAMWRSNQQQGTLFDTNDGSIVPALGSLHLVKPFGSNDFAEGTYEMMIQFHFTYQATAWKQTYLYFTKLNVFKDVNPI